MKTKTCKSCRIKKPLCWFFSGKSPSFDTRVKQAISDTCSACRKKEGQKRWREGNLGIAWSRHTNNRQCITCFKLLPIKNFRKYAVDYGKKMLRREECLECSSKRIALLKEHYSRETEQQ